MQNIAIVGAGGRMGTWFVNYFTSRNAMISAYDVNRQSLRFASPAVKIEDDLASSVEGADFVLICVPVGLTPSVIRQCSSHMKAGAVLGEISSVKHRTFPAITKIRKDLMPLCIHPMFGPGATDRKQRRVLLVPVRDRDKELRKATALLDDATLITVRSARAHDDAIGIVLGLTYFTNLAFASIISREDAGLTEEISGTTFRLQSIIAESIMTDDPELVAALIRDNPYALKHIRQYLKQALSIAKLASRDHSRLVAEVMEIGTRMQSRRDVQESYRRLYSAVKAIDG